MREQKIVLVAPAYNAEKTLISFLKTIPRQFFKEIILVDDCSSDKTFAIAKKQTKIYLQRTPRRLGYGGNLKICLGIALERRADVVVELHPDREYRIDGIGMALEAVIKKGAKLVLGNRFHREAIQRGMFWWKYLFIRLLTVIDNMVLETHIGDMHQGFRVYTKEFLERVNFKANSNGYISSFEIIVQAAFYKMRIISVPVSTFYKGKKRGASLNASIHYSLGTFRVLFRYLLAKLGLKGRLFSRPKKVASCPNCRLDYLVEYRLSQDDFDLFFCKICQNGFTHPVPRNLGKYYPSHYWGSQGLLGSMKKLVFKMFQRRRRSWLTNYLNKGRVLDVGSGEGEFGKTLADNFKVVNIEAPFAKIKNGEVKKIDFLKWPTDDMYDAITFWESLEHMSSPQAYLERAAKLLKKDGFIFIEYPRFGCLESKLFGKHWFHLDMPRHLFHLSDEGLGILLSRVGLTKVKSKSILALDYAPWGFFASFLSVFGVKEIDLKQNVFILIVCSPLLILSVLLEGIFFVLGQAPIELAIARKRK